MPQKTTPWLEEEKRKAQIDDPEGRDSAYFGFQSVPVDEKARRVLNHFNSVAHVYDLMNTLLSFGIHHLWKRTAVQMMALKPGDRVLDVCGGTGDLAILAGRQLHRSGRVVLYDINRDMMNAGKDKVAGYASGKRIQFIQGNAECISFSDRSFDAAMVGFGIRNLTHMETGFKEMHRVLKPGGKMMCLEFSKPTSPVFRWLYDFYSFSIMPWLGEVIAGNRKAYTHLPESIRMFPMPDELSAILRRIGFSEVRYRRLTNGIAVIHLAVKDGY